MNLFCSVGCIFNNNECMRQEINVTIYLEMLLHDELIIESNDVYLKKYFNLEIVMKYLYNWSNNEFLFMLKIISMTLISLLIYSLSLCVTQTLSFVRNKKRNNNRLASWIRRILGILPILHIFFIILAWRKIKCSPTTKWSFELCCLVF